MALVNMQKLLLMSHQQYREEILKLLQQNGCVEVTPVGLDTSMLHASASIEEAARIDASLAELQYAMSVLARSHKIKKSLLGTRREISPDQLQDALERRGDIHEQIACMRKTDMRVSDLRTQYTRNDNLIAQLTPWLALDIPLAFFDDKRWGTALLGVLPTPLSDAFAAAAQSLDLCDITTVSRAADQTCFAVMVHSDMREAFDALAREYGFTRVTLSDLRDKPSQIVSQLEAQQAGLAAQIQALADELSGMISLREDLELLIDYDTTRQARMAAQQALKETGQTFILEGWIPAKLSSHLEMQLEAAGWPYSFSVRDPQEDEVFPTLTQNPAVVQPFEVITDMYSTPDCREMDPTPMMTPFYFIFFGMMVSDAGYGLLMAIACGIFYRLMKKQGDMKRIVGVLALGGISTFIWGAIFGGWFGEPLFAPIWFAPMEEPILMLGLCFGLGAVHIFTGMAVKAVALIRKGRVWDAVFDIGLWYVLLIGLPLMAVPGMSQAGQYMSIAGAAGLVLTQGRSAKNPVMKFLKGLLALYDITGFLSDVLSYSRLFALGLATGVVGMVVNIVGNMLGGSVIGYVLMAAMLMGGHLFNLVINVLGAYVHASRLQYIEFFGKFYEGGGHAFAPLNIETQYVEMKRS